MIHPVAVARRDEVGLRAETMARFLRETPMPFTRILTLWAGYGLRREPRSADTGHRLTARQGRLFGGLPAGRIVVRREGWLVPRLGTDGPRLAAITALVHRPSLELDGSQQADLDCGYVPLGLLLADARRVTYYACPVSGDDGPDPDLGEPLPDEAGDVPVLRCQAVLLSGGRPVALVRETVYETAFTGRRPPDVLPHLRPAALVS